jgi:ABC-2 type transport system ATP-binding protein
MKQTVVEKAQDVDLTNDLDKRVIQISPGCRRKLSIAMALIGEARIIILDEPTSNLDLQSRQKIWSLIRKIV